ncbi:MAG: DUF4347 domain-containing protein [Alphaproteobacteria bacterium]|nr:DUF4347 domain-containing protein [Alphaproteobacteria bacterium]
MTKVSDTPAILENSTGRVLFARALEPRFMLDGAAAVTVVDAVASVPDASSADGEQQSETQTLVDSLAPAEDNSENSGSSVTEIAFVDAGVENYEALIAGLPNGVEVIVLDANSDGISQISAALEGRTGIDAIHILSHGNDGTATLGNAVLSNDTIGAYASQIASWGDALSDSADILFYGCNIAGGSTGEALVAELAQLSGADIAASTDITGAADQGGDWVLEHTTGIIEAADTITATSMAAFGGALITIDTYDANQLVDTDPGTAGTPLTSAVNDASIFGTEREITITATAGTASTFEVDSATNPGEVSFGNGVGSQATVEILYDGVGTGGFAGTDFTFDGANSGVHDRFLFNITNSDFTNNLTLEVTSSGGRISELTLATPGVTLPGPVLVAGGPVASGTATAFAALYGAFTAKAGGAGAADFTEITSLRMTFATTNGLTDLRLDFLATSDTTVIPPTPPGPPPTPGPNPTPTPDPPATPPVTDDTPEEIEPDIFRPNGDSASNFHNDAPRDLSNPVPDYGTIGLHVGHAVNGRDSSILAQYDGNTTDVKSGIGTGAGFSLQNAVTGNQDANINDATFGTGGLGDHRNLNPQGERTSSGNIGAVLNALTPGAGGNPGGPTGDNGQILNPAQESFFLNTGDTFAPQQTNDSAQQVFSLGADGQIQPSDARNTTNDGLGAQNSTGPADLNSINTAFDNLAPTSGSNAGPQERFGIGPNGQVERLQEGNNDGFGGLFGDIGPVTRPDGQLLSPEEERFYLGLDGGLQRQVGDENQPPRPNERFFLFENGGVEGQPNDSGQQWAPPENNLERDVDGNPQQQIGDGQLTSLEGENQQPANSEAVAFDLQGVLGLTAQLDTEANAFDDRRDNLLASLTPVGAAPAELVAQAA